VEPELVSPSTGRPLHPVDGALVDDVGARFEVVDGVPRFVGSSYADSFGEQWTWYRRTQLDSVTGLPLSRERLLAATGWPPDLQGQRVLEVGCGAGRFTEVLLAMGAEVWAVDASSAVDVCRANVGEHERLHLVQADLFALPFPPGSFDRVLCLGVLQHTPDPRAAFLAVAAQARPGGWVAADVYRVAPYVDRWSAKRLWRPLTTRLPRGLLRRVVELYVPRWLPVDTRLARVPRVGRFLTAAIPCWNYTGLFPLSAEQLRAWAVLDTFDALSPRYDIPATLDEVREWVSAAGLTDADVRYGGNGIELSGRAPA
jgi:SAM-dependent methyltransferase